MIKPPVSACLGRPLLDQVRAPRPGPPTTPRSPLHRRAAPPW